MGTRGDQRHAGKIARGFGYNSRNIARGESESGSYVRCEAWSASEYGIRFGKLHKVELFPPFPELLQQEKVEVELPALSNDRALLDVLAAQFPALKEYTTGKESLWLTLVVRGSSALQQEGVLLDGDRLQLLSPLSGG